MDVADTLSIHQLLALYGHVVDERDWDRMDDLFTADLVFDASDFGSEVAYGIAALRHVWETTDQHPLAHHATNIVISQGPDGVVHVLSKGIGIGAKGRAGSVVYRDIVRKEADGWRIARRLATLRRA